MPVNVSNLDFLHSDFRTFVTDTFRHLRNMEARHEGGASGLTTFCRLDIALILKDNNFGYYVHQVNRHMDCHLWLGKWMDEHVNHFVITLYDCLLEYLTYINR